MPRRDEEHLGVGQRQLRFGRDLRLRETRKLLTPAASVTVRLPNNPEVSLNAYTFISLETRFRSLLDFAQRVISLMTRFRS